MNKKFAALIFLVLLNTNLFADNSLNGAYTSSNNFGSNLADTNNGGGNVTNPSLGTGTTITINGSNPSLPTTNQAQIIGSDATSINQQDQTTSQKSEQLSNGYLNFGGQRSELPITTNGIRPNLANINYVPDEFQINVHTRTGLWLNRYGYNLFNNPNTFTPIEDVPVSTNYILGPGDQISIKAWGSIDIMYIAEVDKEGNIFIPKVGKISLAGVKAGDLDDYLKSKVGRIYRNFSLSTTVSKIHSMQINVTGFAKRPGTYLLSSLSTLTNALFASGGPSPQGSLRHIQLKRNGIVIADYDMYDLLLKGDSSSDIHLLPGDIIYIKPYGMPVAIYDGVKVPGIYEAKDGDTVADLVRFAGGYTFNNTKSKIIIEKLSDHNKIDVFNYDFKAGLKQPVASGEIIHFFKMPNRYNDAIVLIGNIANPSRYNWHPGITIKDIIPNKELLLTKSFWNSYSYNTYAKDNLLGQLGVEKTNNWATNNLQSSQYSTGLNTVGGDNQGNLGAFSGGNNLFIAGPVAIPEADINWHYAVIIRLDSTNYGSKIIPFDLERAIAGDPANNLQLQPGDVINILSSKDVRNPTKTALTFVFIDGEVNRPGVYELASGSNLVDAINAAGGITQDAYLYGMELDRQEVKQRQKAALNQMIDNVQQTLLSQASNSVTSAISSDEAALQNQILVQQQAFINKLKQLQPSGRVVLNFASDKVTLASLPNISLENGDTIYIPPTPTTIDVLGQVYNPATFIYNRQETLGDYLNKAGTPNSFADTSSIYVLHADGTLYSKQQAGWYTAFNSQHLYPGDAIVVPQKIQFSTLTKNLIDWTQILSNLGFGVAAVKQLGS